MTRNAPDHTVSLLGMTPEEMRLPDGPLRALPPFRARQVARWIYGSGETSFDAMTDLPVQLRHELASHYTLAPDQVLSVKRSDGDEAVKFLIGLEDGRRIETVLIRTPSRRTICVSSQTGCAYGCLFCATGSMGAGRNLSAGEILSQIMTVRRFLGETDATSGHNIVFMGMGEPLANTDAVIRVLRLLQDHEGTAVGNRRITVSTVGLPDGIRRLAGEGVKVRLAFSLNATTDEVRSGIMPVNRRHPFRRVFEALQDYQDRQRSRVTLEYVLLDRINDTRSDAVRLAGFARRHRFRVNLIAYNPHPASTLRPTPARRIRRFAEAMSPIAPTVTLRYSKGRDILAACGQLSTAWTVGEAADQG